MISRSKKQKTLTHIVKDIEVSDFNEDTNCKGWKIHDFPLWNFNEGGEKRDWKDNKETGPISFEHTNEVKWRHP
jgi:hypothetical protein